MKTNLTFVRPSACALAAAALMQTAAFAAPIDDADTLPVTVVTAGRFHESAASQTQGMSVITAQDIARSGARSVSEALQRVLGFLPLKLDLSGGGNSGVDLRGYGETAWSNQVLIVDGIRMNEGDMSSPQINGLPIDSIERIEVVRGAASVLYGEGASAGAIIITTKAGLGVARKTGANVSVGLGSFQQREWAADATFAAANGFSLDAAVQKSSSDNHRQNFDADNKRGSLGAQWSNDWLRLGATMSSTSQKGGLPGALTNTAYSNTPSQAGSYTQRYQQHSDQHGLFAQAQLSNWELASEFNWREKALRSTDNGGFFSDFDLKSRSSNLRARHQIKSAGFNNAFIMGYDNSKWDNNKRASWSTGSVSARNQGWYVKDELTLPASGTQLSLGLRKEKVERTNSTSQLKQNIHAWDVGVAQTLTSEWTAFARAAKGFRVANVDDINPGFSAAFIAPQISKDLEAGLRWDNTANKMELRVYRSRITNEIGYDPSIPPFGINTNLDPSQRSGLELDALHQISSALSLSANLAARRARFRSGQWSGNTVPLVAKQTLSLGADWQAWTGHTFNARANWVGSQQVDFNNTCRVPAYSTLDAGYRYQRDAWQLNAQVQNLGSKRYYSMAFNCIGGQPNGIYPEAGRSFNVNLRREF